jgi:acyl carrier protein
MKELIYRMFNETLQENGYDPIQVHPELRILEDSSMDSLQLATFIIKLEEVTGKDPFSEGFVPFSTIGELINLYEKK